MDFWFSPALPLETAKAELFRRDTAVYVRLIEAGQLEPESADLYRFARDTIFSSPSAAASIVAGRSAGGPVEWKLEATGQTYRDWRAAQLTATALSPALRSST